MFCLYHQIFPVLYFLRTLPETLLFTPPTGVYDSEEMEKIRREGDCEMLEELKFNNAVREVFLNRFVHMFCAYDHFVIQPNCQVRLFCRLVLLLSAALVLNWTLVFKVNLSVVDLVGKRHIVASMVYPIEV